MWDAAIMGVVEGLTEFLPVSSTGHLILMGTLIGFEGPPGKTFEVTIQLGAVLAVVVVFWGRLLDVARHMWTPGSSQFHFARNITLAMIPALVLGATLHGYIIGLLFTPWVVACALIVGGIVIIWVERRGRLPTARSIEEITPRTAFLIGLGQALAMIPGTSRSGATIITGLLCGLDRRTAAEFSFILAIPTMLAATVYSLWKARADITFDGLAQIGVGFAVSFVVALVTVKLVLAFVQRIGFTPFGWYRIAVGSMILLALSLG